MRLLDLEPKWVRHDPKWVYEKNLRTIGVRFQCPSCRSTQISVLFLNPPDNYPSAPNDNSIPGNNGGKRWARSGLKFEDLTLTPSVDASQVRRESYETDEAFIFANRLCLDGGARHWHGFIRDGEVV